MTARRLYTFGMITYFLSGMLVLVRDLVRSGGPASLSSSSNLTFVSSYLVIAMAFWLLRRALPPNCR